MGVINIGLVGCGLWGPNLAKNFTGNKRTNLKWICDISQEKLDALAEHLKGVRKTTDCRDIFNDREIDAVAIVTPAKAHYEIVKSAMEAGKHVFVEKPLTDTKKSSRELTNLAEKLNRTLMTGYVFLFNGGILRIKDLILSGAIGDIQYMDATRTNLGPIRSDVNTVWDLAAHDISIFLHWMEQVPTTASANGGRYTENPLEDVAMASLKFPDGQIGIIHASWLNPCKVRRITVVGTKQMVVFDDMHPSEPVRLYDKGLVVAGYHDSYGSHRMAVRTGDIVIPHFRAPEPLSAEIEAFLDAVTEGRVNPGIGELPVQVAAVMEAIDESMCRGGEAVTVHT